MTPTWPFGPPRPAPPPTPRPVTLEPAPPEEAAFRAKGLHPWLLEEDVVLGRLETLTGLWGPLRAAQMVFTEGEAA